MADHWTDEEGNLIVDFASANRASRSLRDRKQMVQYGDIDLASGYPAKQIWVTKDGRRIAIPNLDDSHLVNIIRFIQVRVKKYKMQFILAYLRGYTIPGLLFGDLPEGVAESMSEEFARRCEEIQKMPQDKFLDMIIPIYKELRQEAYRRKLGIPSDTVQSGQPDQPSQPSQIVGKTVDDEEE